MKILQRVILTDASFVAERWTPSAWDQTSGFDDFRAQFAWTRRHERSVSRTSMREVADHAEFHRTRRRMLLGMIVHPEAVSLIEGDGSRVALQDPE